MVHVFPIAVMGNNELHVRLVSLATLSLCKSKPGQKGGKIRAAKSPDAKPQRPGPASHLGSLLPPGTTGQAADGARAVPAAQGSQNKSDTRHRHGAARWPRVQSRPCLGAAAAPPSRAERGETHQGPPHGPVWLQDPPSPWSWGAGGEQERAHSITPGQSIARRKCASRKAGAATDLFAGIA